AGVRGGAGFHARPFPLSDDPRPGCVGADISFAASLGWGGGFEPRPYKRLIRDVPVGPRLRDACAICDYSANGSLAGCRRSAFVWLRLRVRMAFAARSSSNHSPPTHSP